jgi:hypothetical protein
MLRMADGGQPMSYHKRRAAFHPTHQRWLNQRCCFSIQGLGRFIQDQYAGITNQRPGNCQALLLPTRIDVLNLLANLKARGLFILFITHDLSLANHISVLSTSTSTMPRRRPSILSRGIKLRVGRCVRNKLELNKTRKAVKITLSANVTYESDS